MGGVAYGSICLCWFLVLVFLLFVTSWVWLVLRVFASCCCLGLIWNDNSCCFICLGICNLQRFNVLGLTVVSCFMLLCKLGAYLACKGVCYT